ncbi:hypothetical protein FQA39_LY02590 [Lamprigera yunnana]|nr:hypothetical protein FQA39_LY02590 [Lamprigera yunnana]
MAKSLQDFPEGPLDYYRKKANFDWKKLKTYIYTKEVLDYQETAYKELQNDPVFKSNSFVTPTLQEQRRLAAIRTFTINKLPSLSVESTLANARFQRTKLKILIGVDPSAAIKNSIAFGMFPSAIKSLGSERHLSYLISCFDGDIVGAYCLTEIGHGSNAKSIQTTALYDKETQEFILHTPTFEAAKCWAGNLGEMATHAIVFAQLITPDRVNHSAHPFIVEIRDPQTLLPYPGITVGDMGEKIALNGVDNGFLMFNQFRVPRINLLNKTGDVTVDGKYVTPFKDPNKRYGASLGALSVGRLAIIGLCSTYATAALTIAIRYAAIRKQFGPEGGEEIPILEYQSHQHRLIPYLSATYVLEMFSNYIGEIQYKFILNSIGAVHIDNAAELGLEIHAISSGCKPLAGWMVRDAAQECREACAGHGYLKAAGLGDIRNSNDANCTYEGENHILIQQTSNWLLKFWPIVLKGEKIKFPLKSVDFLSNALQILRTNFNCKTVQDFANLDNIISMYKWLVCYLLKVSHEKYEQLSQNMEQFWAKSESQVYYLKHLAAVYVQHFMIEKIYNMVLEADDLEIKNILKKILTLYGVWTLEKYLTSFYEGGYANGPNLVTFVQTSILNLCKDLKNDAVALVDVIAPPDFLNNSVLGQSDGLVYKHLEASMVPGASPRPSWWKEVDQWRSKLHSKL